MTDTSARNRQSAGQPTGGQFATEAKSADTGVTLESEAQESRYPKLAELDARSAALNPDQEPEQIELATAHRGDESFMVKVDGHDRLHLYHRRPSKGGWERFREVDAVDAPDWLSGNFDADANAASAWLASQDRLDTISAKAPREWTTEERNHTADTIRRQITPGVLMSLGARKMGHFVDEGSNRPGLAMQTSILPFNADGRRSSRPRTMRARVIHEASDTYRVVVDYAHRGKPVTHHDASGIHADQLARHMLALDSDHDKEDETR